MRQSSEGELESAATRYRVFPPILFASSQHGSAPAVVAVNRPGVSTLECPPLMSNGRLRHPDVHLIGQDADGRSMRASKEMDVS